MSSVTTSLKRKRAIKRELDSGTPRENIKKRYKRGDQLINSVNKTPSEKLFESNQTKRGSSGSCK